MIERLTSDEILERVRTRPGGLIEIALDGNADVDVLISTLHYGLAESEVSAKDRVAVVRGDFCETADDMFREFAAVLQFPLYFGANWAAFADSLGDNRTVEETLVLVLSRATSALIDEKSEQTGWLVQQLAAMAGESQPRYPESPSFTVIFVDTEAKLNEWHKKLPAEVGK